MREAPWHGDADAIRRAEESSARMDKIIDELEAQLHHMIVDGSRYTSDETIAIRCRAFRDFAEGVALFSAATIPVLHEPNPDAPTT